MWPVVRTWGELEELKHSQRIFHVMKITARRIETTASSIIERRKDKACGIKTHSGRFFLKILLSGQSCEKKKKGETTAEKESFL